MPYRPSRYDDWLNSAEKNWASILNRKRRSDPCSLIEHYTDVIAEATVAEALATQHHAGLYQRNAAKLARRATHAQRGAVAACRRNIKPKGLSGASRRR